MPASTLPLVPGSTAKLASFNLGCSELSGSTAKFASFNTGLAELASEGTDDVSDDDEGSTANPASRNPEDPAISVDP